MSKNGYKRVNKFPPVLIAKILGHTWADRQITSVYNRWEKLPEICQALERWASRLNKYTTDEPAKVVKMR